MKNNKGSGKMDLEKTNNNSMIIKYQNTDNVLEDICSIIESARNYAYQSVNIALVERNWFIGYRIAEEELKGENRADYGTEILKKLSKELKKEYGKGFELRNLYYFLQFYKTFPNILHSANAKSNILLSWTHYKTLLQVEDEKARLWYEKETAEQTWSVRTLQRNISSQYYYRLLKSQVKEPVIEEMKEKNKEHYLVDKLEFVKNPLIAEFLGFSLEDSYTETELETSIINNYSELNAVLENLRNEEREILLKIKNIDNAFDTGSSFTQMLKDLKQQTSIAEIETDEYTCPLCGHECKEIAENDSKLIEATEWLDNELRIHQTKL